MILLGDVAGNRSRDFLCKTIVRLILEQDTGGDDGDCKRTMRVCCLTQLLHDAVSGALRE